MNTSVTVIIPTCNAGDGFADVCSMLQKQTANIKEVMVIDSSSTDETAAIARKSGFTVKVIDRRDFGHGRTRQMALEMAKTDVVCYMTQDALLTEESSVEKLVAFLLQDEWLGAVYGRQLPYSHTGPTGAFARVYNYPARSFVNTLADRNVKGFKTAFFSNTFAIYKKELLLKVGGFPVHSTFGEDSYVAAKMLLSGFKTGYCAEAAVYHSHDFSLAREWERSKRIKQFHQSEPWIVQTFGKPEREGVNYVLAQIQWLAAQGNVWSIPFAIVGDVVKYLGYRVG